MQTTMQGRDGITVDWMVMLLITLMTLVGTIYLAVPGILSTSPASEGAEAAVSQFRTMVEKNCGQSDVGATKNIEFDVPQAIATMSMADGGTTYTADLQNGKTLRLSTERCATTKICADGESGKACSTGGSLESGEVIIDIYYDGRNAIVDPSPVCIGTATGGGCTELTQTQCGEVRTCTWQAGSCTGDGGSELCSAVNTFTIDESDQKQLCNDVGCTWQ